MKVPSNITIGLTSTEIVTANDHRIGVFIRNLSSANVALAFGADAELNKGIVLRPDEGFSMGNYDFSSLAINAIADKADSDISIQEFE